MLNVEFFSYGTLQSQVPIGKMEHESTAKINSLLVNEILGPWRTSAIGVVKVKTKIILGNLLLLCSLPSCRQRMVLFTLLVHSKNCLQNCLHVGLHISDVYFAIAPPKTPISLRSSL